MVLFWKYLNLIETLKYLFRWISHFCDIKAHISDLRWIQGSFGMIGEKRKERIEVSHLGGIRREMILVFYHRVWMSKKENHVRWGYGSDFFFFICILKGNLGIVNNTQPIIFVFFYFSPNLTILCEKQIGLVSGFSFSLFLTLYNLFCNPNKGENLISLNFFSFLTKPAVISANFKSPSSELRGAQ